MERVHNVLSGTTRYGGTVYLVANPADVEELKRDVWDALWKTAENARRHQKLSS